MEHTVKVTEVTENKIRFGGQFDSADFCSVCISMGMAEMWFPFWVLDKFRTEYFEGDSVKVVYQKAWPADSDEVTLEYSSQDMSVYISLKSKEEDNFRVQATEEEFFDTLNKFYLSYFPKTKSSK